MKLLMLHIIFMSTYLLQCNGFGEQTQFLVIRKAIAPFYWGHQNTTAAYEAFFGSYFGCRGRICIDATRDRIRKDEDTAVVNDSILSMKNIRSALNFVYF